MAERLGPRSATETAVSTDKKKPLTPEQFVLRAIETLGDPAKSRGIHTVYSGFNSAFREYFPGLDPVEVTTQLADEGKIEVRFRRGGAMIYKAGEAPKSTGATEVLRKMGLNDPH